MGPGRHGKAATGTDEDANRAGGRRVDQGEDLVIEEGVRLRVPVHEGVALSALPRGLPDMAGAPGLTGIPFLLVHGLASNARMWDGVARELDALGHPVIAIDQRGHGRADKPDDGYDFATLTEDLVAVIDEMDIDPPIVVGQSWGGNVVLELAARHPDRVRGVVAVDGGTIELSAACPTGSRRRSRWRRPTCWGTPVTDWRRGSGARTPTGPRPASRARSPTSRSCADGTVAPWLTRERHMTILRQLWEHHPSRLVPARSGCRCPCCSRSPSTTTRRASSSAGRPSRRRWTPCRRPRSSGSGPPTTTCMPSTRYAAPGRWRDFAAGIAT